MDGSVLRSRLKKGIQQPGGPITVLQRAANPLDSAVIAHLLHAALLQRQFSSARLGKRYLQQAGLSANANPCFPNPERFLLMTMEYFGYNS
jgi:hypothetical protein